MSDNILHCEVHPDRETSLRCNKCGRPMCMQCAVRTPVGYRCRQCVRGQQAAFFNAQSSDYLVAGVASFLLALVGGVISIPSYFLAFFIGPAAGTAIVNAVRWATQKRRGQYTVYVVIGGIVLGGGLPLIFLRGGAIGSIIFVALAVGTAWSWLNYGKRY